MLSVQDSAWQQHQINIPVDYYRILGVPLQATSEQIEQAHRDRSLQMPRVEYSQEASNLRQQLIKKAYQILSNPQRRKNYDAQFLEFSPSSTGVSLKANIPELTIEPAELVGALIILQELGEYDLVLKLGSAHSHLDLEPTLRQDLLLSMALANLELGREKWYQGKYEQAASFLLRGGNLLTQERLFVKIQSEIKRDMSKLRPYRILELLSLDLKEVEQRQQGLDLLQEMLDQRQGIEGKGNDESGLNIDDFLRFIQQIQTYLTVAEQQEIFEKEAKRPSAVATYLAFYALLARGFAEKKPELIFRAKTLLKPLLKHQDIYLEQAVCNLLLGQTNAALKSLEKTQETQTLDFIQQQSQDSPDLLPGLCLYSERWLHSEVFPHFRDLLKCELSLEEYFNDPHVQNYLESLPPEIESITLEPKPEPIIETNRNLSAREQLVNASSLNSLNTPISEPKTSVDVSMGEATRTENTQASRRRKKFPFHIPKSNSYLWRIMLATLLGLGFLTVMQAFWKRQLTPQSQLSVRLDQPLVTMPSPEVKPTPPPVTVSPPTENAPSLLNLSVARQVVERWFDAKSRAYGTNHEIEALSEILTGSLLETRQKIAERVKQENSHREYEQALELQSVSLDKNNPQRGSIIANVRETAKYYQDGNFLAERSYSSNLQVRYDLVLVDQQWLIQGIELVE